MLPTLRDGDLVELRPVAGLSRGDVVTFLSEGGLLTHRVVAVDGGEVRCRGDDKLWDDRPVPLQAVLGRVETVVGRGPLLRVDPLWSAIGLRRVARVARHRLRQLTGRLPLQGR
jgi:hypothetical protein